MWSLLTERRELRKGIYTVYGPYKGVIKEGEVIHVGRILRAEDDFFVPKDHTSCVKVVTEKALIEIPSSIGGRLELSDERNEPIDEWIKTSGEILREGYRVVIVVGEPDSGKSSFTTFLTNYAISNGLKVAVIDSDPGQNDIGYPGTIALAAPKRQISWLRELSPEKMFFIGSTSPMDSEDMVILGVHRLVEEARASYNLVIVNTDGWVKGSRASRYKSRLIIALKPSAIVVMEGSGACDYLGRFFDSIIRVFKVRSPSKKLSKEHKLRRIRREISYVDLLIQSSLKVLPLNNVRFLGTLMFSGEEVSLEPLRKIMGSLVLRAERVGEHLIVFTKGRVELKKLLEAEDQIKKAYSVRAIRLVLLEELKGLLVGLLNRDLEFKGIGVLNRVDLESKRVYIMTYVNEEDIAGIVPGIISISNDGKEIRRMKHLI